MNKAFIDKMNEIPDPEDLRKSRDKLKDTRKRCVEAEEQASALSDELYEFSGHYSSLMDSLALLGSQINNILRD